MKTLHLTLKKEPFEVMVTGEKPDEYRVASAWILSRLFNKDGSYKHYDRIKFVNGYGSDKPYFITDFWGCYQNMITQSLDYSNGLRVIVARGDWVICTKTIFERGNLKIPDAL